MINIEELMEFAMEKLQQKLGDNGFTDDWAYGDDCFRCIIVWDDDAIDGPYLFVYDADEEYCGTGEQQVLRWIDSIIW